MKDDFPQPPKTFDRWFVGGIVAVALFAVFGFAGAVL